MTTTHTTKSVRPTNTCSWIVNPLRIHCLIGYGGDNTINFQGSGSTGTLTGSNKCPIRYNQPDAQQLAMILPTTGHRYYRLKLQQVQTGI